MLNHKRHFISNIQAHIVLVVKYRKTILSKRIIELIEDEVKELSNEYSFCVLDIVFGTDKQRIRFCFYVQITLAKSFGSIMYCGIQVILSNLLETVMRT